MKGIVKALAPRILLNRIIRGVAFDLEGTVIDVEFAHFEAFRLTALWFEIVMFKAVNTAEDISRHIAGAIGGGDPFVSKGISELSGGRVSPQEISERKAYFYNQIIESLKTIEPRGGFLEVFGQIQELELPRAITSLTVRSQAEVLLQRSGVGELFPRELILLEDFGGKVKPEPDVYIEAARRMGIKPEEMLVFEDSGRGATAGKRAGALVVGMPVYTFRAHITALQEAGASYIFTSWQELCIA